MRQQEPSTISTIRSYVPFDEFGVIAYVIENFSLSGNFTLWALWANRRRDAMNIKESRSNS